MVTARPGKYAPLGYEQKTSLAAAVALTVPVGASNCALIRAESQDVRWRDDGTDPTAAVGMVLPAGTDMWYDGNLAALRFIEATASAKLSVSYYTNTLGVS